MSEEYGNDFVTLTDDEGNEQEFEHLGTLTFNDQTYMAFIPAYENPEEFVQDEAELLILKCVEENGEEILATIEDDAELEEVYSRFMDELSDFYEEEEEEEAPDEPEEPELH